jgi:hypothetical protein
MPREASDWRTDVETDLINASTTGIMWKELYSKYGDRVKAQTLRAHLLALRAENKVQEFKIPLVQGSGSPATVWRATTLILSSSPPADSQCLTQTPKKKSNASSSNTNRRQ